MTDRQRQAELTSVAAEVVAHCRVCSACEVEAFTAGRSASCCPAGADLRRRYRRARRRFLDVTAREEERL